VARDFEPAAPETSEMPVHPVNGPGSDRPEYEPAELLDMPRRLCQRTGKDLLLFLLIISLNCLCLYICLIFTEGKEALFMFSLPATNVSAAGTFLAKSHVNGISQWDHLFRSALFH
jgi:hypothetical protein